MRVILGMMVGTVVAVAGAGLAKAQEWNTDASDQRVDKVFLEENLVGNSLVYEGGQKSLFNVDGSYTFVAGGKSYQYVYEFTEGGEVCISSAEYGARCDLLVLNGESYVSINDKGERYKATLEPGI